MGCRSTKAAEPSQQGAVAPGPTDENIVPELRRRLSLGEIGDDCEPVTGDISEEDRSLLLQFTQQQVFDFMTESQSGRRLSLTSAKDSQGHNVRSFASKEVVLQGEQRWDSSKELIGFACKKGLKPEAPNQDSFLIMKLGDRHHLYGVFDGHGRKGHDVSNFVKENIPKILLSQESFPSDPLTALMKTFEKMQFLLIKATAMNAIDATRSGTTCSFVLHDVPTRMLYIAHVGDSRIVLGRQEQGAWQAVELTIDHKPDLPAERKRIEKAGGVVIFDGGWNYRVFAKDKLDSRGKRYPGLNMSRAMGDLNGFNDAGISAIPDVNKRSVDHSSKAGADGATLQDAAQGTEDAAKPAALPTDQAESSGKTDEADFNPAGSQSSRHSDFTTPSVTSHEYDPGQILLLCSDGVWEFVSSHEAVQEVGKFPASEAFTAAEHLAGVSWDRWMHEMDSQVVDDITALIVHLS